MTRKRLVLFSPMALLATALTTGCGDGAVEPPPPPTPVPTTITISPASATLQSLGEAAQLIAEVRDQNGQAMANAAVAWTSSDPSVATVAGSGLVTAIANGTATVTATAGSASGTAAVTVDQVVASVAVDPPADTLLAFGDTLRLSVAALDANGNAVASAEFAWASADTLVAVVDQQGLVTGGAAGEVEVTATSANMTGRAQLAVLVPTPATVAIQPDTVGLNALGQTVRLAAEVRDRAGRAMEGVPVSWSSGDTLIATVDSAGLVTAAGNGTTTVAATADSASGQAAVTVMQSAGSVVLSPATDTISPGDTLRLAASAFDGNGHMIDATEFEWSSSDVSVARVDASGLVTAVSEGMTTVTAAAGHVRGTAEIRVENLDRAALVALYNATDGPNWVNSENWLTDVPLGEWYGVRTNRAGRVVSVSLPGRWNSAGREWIPHGLSGTLPPELGLLTELEVLLLYYNGISGTLPRELGDLENLVTLSLWGNGLIGVIPPALGDLTNLRTLELQVNNLTGSIPAELGALTNLRHLNLAYNDLEGPIQPELRTLTKLEGLSLQSNNLTDVIPPWLSQHSELRELDLRDNELIGSIPPELGNLRELRKLLLSWNGLTGTIPPELTNLTQLTFLFLHANHLTGVIPPDIGNLGRLVHLALSGNNLSGPIPPELGKLTNLASLDLANANLAGQLPSELGNLHQLERLSLSGNALTGAFPLSFLALDKLESLGCQRTEGLCLPATDEFREWARQVEARGDVTFDDHATFCDEIDAQALEAFYEAARGDQWVRSDGWLDDENLGRWHGVGTDSIGRVATLDLSGNGLSGSVPDALGFLANLTELRIGDNALIGRLPLSLAGLPLKDFGYSGTSICVPDDAGFRGWLNGIPRHSGTELQCPPLTDRDILESLYWSTDGANWRRRTGWTTDAALDRWDGVATDAAGRVVELRLRFNGLSGRVPVELGQLSELRVLDLTGNTLSGSIPHELGDLGRLEVLALWNNRLTGSIPPELGRLSKLAQLLLSRNQISGSIPPRLGDLDRLEVLRLVNNQLTGEIPGRLADLANLRDLQLEGNFLSGPVPRSLGSLSRLKQLNLASNQLVGSIPSELGKLEALLSIQLADNQLTGRIPPQLGALGRLSTLDLSGNQLTGSLPSELGDLANLVKLSLSGNAISGSIPTALGRTGNLAAVEVADNQLSGPIPTELGRLAKLVTLDLGNNQLAGPLPAELGRATSLEILDLRSNQLTGPVPPQYGSLSLMRQFILADNPGLAGPMPPEILAIAGIERLMAGGTDLCWPPEPAYAAWFSGIADRRLARCQGGATAYLIQTVQSWDDPVPLLAGEPALLRVFVTAPKETTATMPDVRATFFVDGVERHSVRIAAGTQPIPSDVVEGSLARSANAEIPARVIVPGLEMVIEVDPSGTLDPVLGVTKRIPAHGRMAIHVQPVSPLHVTMVPLLLESRPDSTAVTDVQAMAADPEGHELLREVRRLLPIAELAVVARTPVITSSPDSYKRLGQIEAMRLMEGGSGYYMGISDGRTNPGLTHSAILGVAYLGGRASVSVRSAQVMAHELGHNLSLRHAPCGSPASVDPWFPHVDGRIGAWGYDFQRDVLVTPQASDVMSYCKHSGVWISDFFFNKALLHRLDEPGTAMAANAEPAQALLLWGGRDEEGIPHLDPAFVVDAVPSLPAGGGEYAIEGATFDGTPIFSFTFDMPVNPDAEGEEASFVFTLPTRPEWADNLASITLSGPGGSVVLNETTDQPMAILRDPGTGRVRAFLSDLPPSGVAEVAADAAGTGIPGPHLDVLLSRGIPDAEAWRR